MIFCLPWRPRDHPTGHAPPSTGARPEHLLDVAASMLNEAGFKALTIEGLAERAGVRKGLGYVSFENADDRALALFDREVARIYH